MGQPPPTAGSLRCCSLVDEKLVGFLEVELLRGVVKDPEPRVGDGLHRMVSRVAARPYVLVELDQPSGEPPIAEQTLPVVVSWRDEGFGECEVSDTCLSDGAGINVDFGKPRLVFPIYDDPDTEDQRILRLSLKVSDKRPWQPVQRLIRGDPVVGQAELCVPFSATVFPVRGVLQLRRDDSDVDHGRLMLQYTILDLERMREVVVNARGQALKDVVLALEKHLMTESGKETLWDSRPAALRGDKADQSSARLQERLDQLVGALQQEAQKLNNRGSKPDDAVIQQLAPFVRRIVELVSDPQFMAPGTTDPIGEVVTWIQDFCSKMTQAVPELNVDRLKQLLESGLEVKDLRPADANGQLVQPLPRGWQMHEQVAGSVLGAGAFGFVWRAKDLVSQRLFAVKALRVTIGQTVRDRERSVVERLSLLPHPCVVQLFKAFEEPDRIFLVMELCEGGDLISKIQDAKQLRRYTKPARAEKWAAQIFLGLEFLHLTVQMMHRDVKPENVVLSAGGLCAKLTDFGVSRLDTTANGQFSFGFPPGSPAYVAPEVVQKYGYDCRADLYSFGELLWVLLTGGLTNTTLCCPPCTHVAKGQPIARYSKNWELLKACIERPEEHFAMPLLPMESEMVLWLTDRAPDWRERLKDPIDFPGELHRQIREHELFRQLNLPEVYATRSMVEEWTQAQ